MIPLLLAAAVSIATLTERELSIGGPMGALKGTLVNATAPESPVVLVIPGSGPTDRDGNSPLGVRASTYRLLAEELAVRGISSARIDKRGMFASAAAIPDPNVVSIEDYVSDVHAWIDSLRSTTGRPCVWLLGHSEGGLVALAAAQSGEGICGLVLAATPGRPLGDLLREQLRANPNNAPLLSEAEKIIESLEAGQRVDVSNIPGPLATLFRPEVQGFLIGAFILDPQKLAAKIDKPILIIQGDRDLQIDPEHARTLKAAAPKAKEVILPNVNHVLKSVSTDDYQANIATYGDPDMPLADGVADIVADFIRSCQQRT
ncbi:MAG: alpha/beta fold hydrolase [Sphingomonadales bacterium]|nr:MAG: alpha/beta fold hydrolase [Sphingomonadales bacterium]